MTAIYILYHSYENDDCEETKLIGAYSTLELANEAKERAVKLPGFRDLPEAFEIVKQPVNRDEWTEGFATLMHLEIINHLGKAVIVEVEVLGDNKYRIIEYYNEDQILPYKHNEIIEGIMKDGQFEITKK